MRVFSNTAMSADGKIGTVLHDHVAIGSAADRRGMSRLRAQADAVLVGGKTFRNWPLPLIENPEHLGAAPHRDRPVLNAVLTRTGVLDARARPGRWPDERVELVVYGGPELDVAAHNERFGAACLTTATPSVDWVLDDLESRGCRSVLVEGGGGLIFAVLQAGRLDELFITVCPLLIGGASAPTPLDGAGLSADDLRRLQLLECERIEDELFLHYAVHRSLQ